MRVLFLTHSYPRWMGDAAGSFLLRLATALGDRDVQVRVLAPNAAGLARDEVIGGIPVHRFRYAPRTWETLAYTGTMAEDARASLKGGAALGGLLPAASRPPCGYSGSGHPTSSMRTGGFPPASSAAHRRP